MEVKLEGREGCLLVNVIICLCLYLLDYIMLGKYILQFTSVITLKKHVNDVMEL